MTAQDRKNKWPHATEIRKKQWAARHRNSTGLMNDRPFSERSENVKLYYLLIIVFAFTANAIVAEVTDPTWKDTDHDGFLDGPDLYEEREGQMFLHVGEDKNGNGKYEPEGADGILGTEDDEYDPLNASSHPEEATFRFAFFLKPELKAPTLPMLEPAAGLYHFYTNIETRQVVPEIPQGYGRGLGEFILNIATHELHYTVSVRGLNVGPVVVRLRGYAARGSAVDGEGVALVLASRLDARGVLDLEDLLGAGTAVFESQLYAGNVFLEVLDKANSSVLLRGQLDVDTDVDGVTDVDEDFYQTDWLDRDSDDDGLLDGEEAFRRGRTKDWHEYALFYEDYMDWLVVVEKNEAVEETGESFSSQPYPEVGSPDYYRQPLLAPADWDMDDDGLADGLEMGVDSAVSGFVLAANALHGGLSIAGTDFPDANQDQLHDVLGYRLIDLAPEEPDTNPRYADTNCNGWKDGEDDANRNGRFDAGEGERDPVMGFYDDYRGELTPLERTKLFLQKKQIDSGEIIRHRSTIFHFGSHQSDLEVVSSPVGLVGATPQVLRIADGIVQSLELSIPENQLSDPPPAEISIQMKNGGTDEVEYVETIRISGQTDTDFQNYVLNKKPLQYENLDTYRVDCDDFIKYVFWKYLKYKEDPNGAVIEEVNSKTQTPPTKWKSKWGGFQYFVKSAEVLDPDVHYNDREFMIHPGQEHIRNAIPWGASRMFNESKLWELESVPEAITGEFGDPGRSVVWENVRPGDVFCVQYHVNGKYGKYDNLKKEYDQCNEEDYKGAGYRIDHVFMYLGRGVIGLQSHHFFGMGSYWTILKGKYIKYDDIEYKNTEKDYAFYRLLPQFLSYNDRPVPRLMVSSDYSSLQSSNKYKIQGNLPYNKALFLLFKTMNTVGDYFKIESIAFDPGGGVVDDTNANQYIRAIMRWYPESL